MMRLTFISLVLFTLSVSAQRYNFRTYSIANGLESSNINHIFQDSKGYIWFATQGGGASRFNGREFRNYTRADGLPSNDVTYITEDKRGSIWIATAQGACKLSSGRTITYRQKEGLTDQVVYSIYTDNANNIWFATKDKGIKILQGSSFHSIGISEGLLSDEVYTITQDKLGNYWFGLANGIAKYNHGILTNYCNKTLREKSFFSSMVDSKGNVWFGSTAGDVLSIQSGSSSSLRVLTLPAALQKDFVGSLAEDQSGNIWMATDHGLLKYDGRDFKLFSEREGLSVNMAQAVMCDYEGNIWAGTLGGGANMLASEAFIQYTEHEGLLSQNVNCIFEDKKHNDYLLGTGEGLFSFNPVGNSFKKVSGIGEIDKANISSIAIDNEGKVWLTAQEGVFVLERNVVARLIKKYTSINGVRLISPNKILIDQKGNCWISSFGSGIFRISNEDLASYSARNGLPGDNILTAFEDIKGDVWFGSDAGLLKFDGKQFTAIGETKHESVWSIAGDEEGNIYCGTGEKGIQTYKDGSLKAFTTKEGLSSNSISSLAWDSREHCLWAGSQKGLDKIVFNEDGADKITNYQVADGLKAEAINQGGILLGSDLIWLGTVNGLWQFKRKAFTVKSIPTKVQLASIRLFYQKADWQKFADSLDANTGIPVKAILPYNMNHLTFDLEALTQSNAQFAFQLAGEDEGWSVPSRNNAVTYSHISPGEYVFKAKAVNAEGNSAHIIAFPFIILTPWWSSWWFRGGIALGVILVLVGFIKIRERSLVRQNLKLEQTVKERTQQIEEQKTLVEEALIEKEGLLKEKEILLKEVHHRVKNNLETISSMLKLQSASLTDATAKNAITESQSRVRSIALVHQKLYQQDKLEKVELHGFVSDLTRQVQSLFKGTKDIEIVVDIPQRQILMDRAIPVGLILNELLTNSFKYAFANCKSGEIRIQLVPDGHQSRLVYRDNGRGISAETFEKATTLGLRIIRLLSKQIGAQMTYSNSNGSEFTFNLAMN